MKKTALLLLVCAYYSVAYTQTSDVDPKVAKNRNMGLEASAGYSIALGTYAAFDQKNKKSGYATSGWLVQLTFDWMGKKDIGLALQYTFQQNPLKDAANLVYPNGIPESAGTGNWSNHYLMFGPVFMKTIHHLHIDFHGYGKAQA
jgi:hypothetical protein